MSTSATHNPSSAQHQVQTGHPTKSTSPPNFPQCTVPDLPSELLLEIFDRVCEPPRALETLPRDIDRHSGPLLLGKICKQWRDIAWSSPLLWTYIYLIPSNDKYVIQTELLDAYLRRSKDLPLTIVFRPTSSGSYEYEGNRLLPLYELIAQECNRWEAIDIFVPHFCVSYMNRTCLNLPRLRIASVEALTGSSLNFIQRAKHLRNLALAVVSLPEPETSYRHLTHFKASKLSNDQVLNVLEATPNLRSCFVEDMTGGWRDAGASPRVHLKHLECLTIRHSSGAESLLLQHILSTPVLREFRCSARPGGYLPLDLVKALLDRSPSCQLEILELNASHLGPSDLDCHLDRLLRRTTTLSRLDLDLDFDVLAGDESFPTNIAKLLNPLWPPAPPFHTRAFTGTFMDSGYPVLLPHLQHLELRLRRTDSLLPVINVLKHRWMFGNAATSDFSSSLPESLSDKQFVKIVSARLPAWCISEVMRELRDELREGLLIDFI